VYIAAPTTNATTTTTTTTTGSSGQYHNTAISTGSTISARPTPASSTINKGYYTTNATITTANQASTAYKSSATIKEEDTTAQGNKNKKIRPTLRMAGGEIWEDATMAEWDESK
jgi:hypothetical protein